LTAQMSRRDVLLAGLALPSLTWSRRALADEPSLAKLAASKQLLYGCAVSGGRLTNDPAFAALVVEEAGILVPEGELKRNAVQPQEGVWNFGGADALSSFATNHNQKFRGHTLVWHARVPPWLDRQLQDNPRESLLTDMITKSCQHFRGRMHSWDVINEVVQPPQGGPNGLRIQSAWYRAFGEGYMATAFHAAREADPKALLFYNETGIEGSERWQDIQRTAVLKLLEKLKKQNVPIDGFGVEGHIKPFMQHFNEDIYARFLREVEGMGLKIMVTELDVADRGGPADVAKRDAEVASATRRFLDVSLANPAMLGVLTWGLSDRYSWLSEEPKYKWPDGQLSRGLPFDDDLKPKPMRTALAAAFSARR
jgi:endo-1,4-beta-xylanase